MDARIKSMVTNGSEFLAEYVGEVVAATEKFTESLLGNVGKLAGDVIRDGTKVVLSACEAFVPGDADEEA